MPSAMGIPAAEALVAEQAGNRSSPRPVVLWAIGSAGVAVAAMSLALAVASDASDIQVALLEWIGAPYTAAGLIAWWRRPESRLGRLMIAGGLATGLMSLQFTQNAALFTFGGALDVLPAAIFLHVYLAFPDGRLRSSLERALVAAAYATGIGLQLVKMSLGAWRRRSSASSSSRSAPCASSASASSRAAGGAPVGPVAARSRC